MYLSTGSSPKNFPTDINNLLPSAAAVCFPEGVISQLTAEK
jgi:hypothetical protein